MRTANESVLIETRPLTGSLKEFQPVTISLVNDTELEPVWDHMVRNYHYLGYHKMIGPRIKYLSCYRDVPIVALSYNDSFRECYQRSDQCRNGETFVKGLLFRP